MAITTISWTTNFVTGVYYCNWRYKQSIAITEIWWHIASYKTINTYAWSINVWMHTRVTILSIRAFHRTIITTVATTTTLSTTVTKFSFSETTRINLQLNDAVRCTGTRVSCNHNYHRHNNYMHLVYGNDFCNWSYYPTLYLPSTTHILTGVLRTFSKESFHDGAYLNLVHCYYLFSKSNVVHF